MNQHTRVTAMSDTRTGCNTQTPILVLSSPVMIGKRDPPICAKTKTIESAVDLVSDENNLDPTDIAWTRVSLGIYSMIARLTAAKRGPEKNPKTLIAIDAAMMFGTLEFWSVILLLKGVGSTCSQKTS
jgi:hypothetical protein